MSKTLKKFGYAGSDFTDLTTARGDTYTTKLDEFPSTNIACDENPFREQLETTKYILDFGCGVGRNLRWIMENTDANYIGLDPNTNMTQFFWDVQYKEHGSIVDGWRDRVTVINDFSQIPLVVKFDYVISTFVLQHLGYRYIVINGMNLTDITQQILSLMNDGAVFFTLEHDTEELWIDRWVRECNIKLDVYIRSYEGLPELTHRDHCTYDGHHLMIFRKHKEMEV